MVQSGAIGRHLLALRVWNPLDNPDPEPLKIQSKWYCLAEIELEVETEESDEDEPDHYASWGQRRRVRTRTKDLELCLSVELVVEDQRIVAWTFRTSTCGRDVLSLVGENSGDSTQQLLSGIAWIEAESALRRGNWLWVMTRRVDILVNEKLERASMRSIREGKTL
jgi:hypothetical protein